MGEFTYSIIKFLPTMRNMHILDNKILVKFALLIVRGHSTTTWTEVCHFLTPPLRGQFLYPERGQKQTFFDPLPHPILST